MENYKQFLFYWSLYCLVWTTIWILQISCKLSKINVSLHQFRTWHFVFVWQEKSFKIIFFIIQLHKFFFFFSTFTQKKPSVLIFGISLLVIFLNFYNDFYYLSLNSCNLHNIIFSLDNQNTATSLWSHPTITLLCCWKLIFFSYLVFCL